MNDFIKGLIDEAYAPPTPVARQSLVLDNAMLAIADDAVTAYEMGDLKLSVVSALYEWAEGELEDDETLTERFAALIIGMVDTNKNGELDDDEMEYVNHAYNLAAEYLQQKGADERDIIAFLQDDDDDAAASVQELLLNKLPDGDEAVEIDMNHFAFGDGSDEVAYDAAYKKIKVVRDGKKIVIKKRISGKVKLSSAQKMALAKARRKSHSGAARKKRMKSMKLRKISNM